MVTFIGGGFPRPTLFTSVISDTDQITIPASVREGDLLVLADFARNSASAVTNVVPTGFTQIVTTAQPTFGFHRTTTSFKVADSDDESDVLTGMDGDAYERKILLVFRGGKKITAAAAQDPDGVQSDGNPSAQTVTSSGGTAPLVVLGIYAAFAAVGAIDPRSMTVSSVDVKDGEVSNEDGGQPSLWVAFKWYYHGQSVPDVVVDMDDEGANFLQSCYIEVS